MTERDRNFADLLDLRLIALHECEVKRGVGQPIPGRASASYAIEGTHDAEDRIVAYLVRAAYELSDPEDQLVATIRTSFVCIYDIAQDVTPANGDVESFGRDRVMVHAAPYLREFVSSMTNRLGVPPFFLPLYRRTDRISTHMLEDNDNAHPSSRGTSARPSSPPRRRGTKA